MSAPSLLVPDADASTPDFLGKLLDVLGTRLHL